MCARGGAEGEGEREPESPLSGDPDVGLHPRTPGTEPEPKVDA